MYCKVLINDENQENIEIKVRPGVLASAEWGVEEDGKDIPSQIIKVLVNEAEGERQAWIQILDSTRTVIQEGIVGSTESSLEAFKADISSANCTVEALDEKDAPSCLKDVEVLKRKCCRRTGRKPNGNGCYVRCCNACCSGGSACSAACCP